MSGKDGPDKRQRAGQVLASIAGRQGETGPTTQLALKRSLIDQRDEAADREHALYLAASGTLMQFNAIMAALLGGALALVDDRSVKLAIVSALALHVLASFVLCWAVRPIQNHTSVDALYNTGKRMANDTFSNYVFGWRLTITGMLVSAVALAVYLYQASASLLQALPA